MTGNTHHFNILTTPLGNFKYIDLTEITTNGPGIDELPFSVRILLENILRNFNGTTFSEEHINRILNWSPDPPNQEIPFLPARVLMQDFTGVPSIVDIASIRSEVARRNKNPQLINPQVPVDLVIDHSVQVDYFGTNYSFQRNVDLEYKRNYERYTLLKWAQSSFENFNVLPPGMGICHQVNLEYLAKVVTIKDGKIFPDTLVGTDSHTPMINGIGVLGWGVGGIEAEAVMLNQPTYIMMPEVIGLKLTGKLKAGSTATDLVLTVAELLRKKGVVGRFVEVFGDGLDNLTVPDRATISNMSPEFGCTVTYFPPDHKTMEYLRNTGRDEKQIETAEQYLRTNHLWRENESRIKYTEVLNLDIADVEPSVSGPKRPQDKIFLKEVKNRFIDIMKTSYKRGYVTVDDRSEGRWTSEGGHPEGYHPVKDQDPKKLEQVVVEVETESQTKDGLKSIGIRNESVEYMLGDGSLVIAAITSCTNTSNPNVMIGAGLLAKKAVEQGLGTKPWVKTSLAPGSKVVTEYLEKARLMPFLEALGFHVVGYGCTTCIGNTGPLPVHISKAITENDLIVGAVLSGNRNFEARIHPMVKMNFLASPILVVAYAIAGRIDINFNEEPVAYDKNLEPIWLKDLWPSQAEIGEVMDRVLDADDYLANYSKIFQGDEKWKTLETTASKVYKWEEDSSYIKEAPFFKDIAEVPRAIEDIVSARVLLKLGDSVTTDHISPAGSIGENSPAGLYLKSKGIQRIDFNSYGSRRGNHEVMIRGTFANVRLKNDLVKREGPYTVFLPDGEEMTVYDAAMKYNDNNIPLIVLAGKEYGSGSSRDWAAKGVSLLGVRAIIAESFERIHRSNLVGMGVLPLEFNPGQSIASLGIEGDEKFDIVGLHELIPNKVVPVTLTGKTGTIRTFNVIARLDSPI
ncbi:MAG TPA: aconitate hydratase [Bacteroidales bacterium]|nr:aconitate hydratase [Bacteroidales bacterium]